MSVRRAQLYDLIERSLNTVRGGLGTSLLERFLLGRSGYKRLQSFTSLPPVDDVRRALDRYTSEACSTELSELIVGDSELSRSRYRSLLENRYIASGIAFNTKFATVFSRIRELSRQDILGEDQRFDRFSREFPAPVLRTGYSLSPVDRFAQADTFLAGITRSTFPSSTDGLYPWVTAFRDAVAREELCRNLIVDNVARSLNLETLMEDGDHATPITIQGLSAHGSVLGVMLNFLRPDLPITGVDLHPYAGYLWLNRGWMRQNNTMGPWSTRRDGFPRQGGNLFTLGDFGAMQIPYFANLTRWVPGDLAGAAILYNVSRHFQELTLNKRIVSIERGDRGYRYRVVSKDDFNRTYSHLTNVVFLSSAGEPKNPFYDPSGPTPSSILWDDQVQRAKFGLDSLCYNFDDFSDLIKTEEGVRKILGNNTNGLPIGVIGAADGGKSIVGWHLLLGPERSYQQMVLQDFTRVLLDWWGQDKKTAKAFARDERGRYINHCVGYTSGRINALPKIAAIESLPGNAIRCYPQKRNGRPDLENSRLNRLLINATGLKKGFPDSMFSGLGYTSSDFQFVYDRDGRAVMSQLGNEYIFAVGDAAQIPLDLRGPDVEYLVKRFAIDENPIAQWSLGPLTKRAAIHAATYMFGKDGLPISGGGMGNS